MRRPAGAYEGPFAGDEKRRRKFLLWPRRVDTGRVLGPRRQFDSWVWLEWVWKVSGYEYIPGRDFAQYAWRFRRYEVIDRSEA